MVGTEGRFEVLEGGPNRLHRRLARHLTGGVAAHAVGDREDGLGDEELVLVVGADLADVGCRSVAELGHVAGSFIRCHLVTSSTVLPTWSRSPRRMAAGPATFLPLSSVP